MTATVCPTCLGEGTVTVGRMSSFAGKIGTLNVEQICKTCDGVGYLQGFKPFV